MKPTRTSRAWMREHVNDPYVQRAKLEGYRSTWLAAGLFDEQDGSEPLARLTPAQRRVYELLVSGAATGDIAESLGRSVFTVRNHIKAVLKAYGVNSRSALLSLSMRNEAAARDAAGLRVATMAKEARI